MSDMSEGKTIPNNNKSGCVIPVNGCLVSIILVFGAGILFNQYRISKIQLEKEKIKLEQFKKDLSGNVDSTKTLVLDSLKIQKQK